MDLYEALKAGTTEEELIRLFQKDLNEAKSRIEEDEKADEQAEYLAECREDLAQAIYDYVEAYFGENIEGDPDFTPETIEKTLQDFEKEMDSFSPFIKILNDIFDVDKSETKEKPIKSLKVKISSPSDDEIIRNFLKSLK